MQVQAQLTKKQLNAIALHLEGHSWAEVARRLKVSRETLYQWRTKNNDFVNTMEEHRKILKEETLKRLTSINTVCLDKLKELLESENEQILAKAVGMGLNYSLRAEDSLLVREEIKELEGKILKIKTELLEEEV